MRLISSSGAVGEYTYMNDQYESERLAQRTLRAEHKKKIVSSLPFRPTNPAKKGAAGSATRSLTSGHGIAGEYKYMEVC